MSIAYLSDAWLEAADELLRAVVVEPPVDAPGFAIETIVTGGPDGERRYGLEFGGATVRVSRTVPTDRPVVRLTQDLPIAIAIARGELSAQAAFLAADIQLGGEVGVLIANAGLLADVGDALAPLRATTVYTTSPEAPPVGSLG